MKYQAEDVSSFAAEYTRCTRCSAVLCKWDFGTDDLGRTVENCSRCGPRLLTVRRDVLVGSTRAATKPRVVGRCECGRKLTYKGTGHVPEWCPDCRAIRKNEGNIVRNKARRAQITKAIKENHSQAEVS